MKTERKYFLSKNKEVYQVYQVHQVYKDETRNCPSCEFETIKGMPGGRDSTCQNCGYKDPCCYD